jgi:hypothetical protein
VKKICDIEHAYNSDPSATLSTDYIDDSDLDTTEDIEGKDKLIRNKNILLSCIYCTQKFSDSKIRESHITDSHTFVCSLCNKIIKGKSYKILEKHIKVVHFKVTKSAAVKRTLEMKETNEFQSVFPIKKSKVIKPKVTFTCEKCCNNYRSSKLLQKHTCLPHFVCNKCSTRFLNHEKFKNHLCKPKRKFNCTECYKSFKNKIILNNHLCNDGYKCKYCKKMICNKQKFNCHSCTIVRNHRKKKNEKIISNTVIKFTCVKCHSKFDTLDKYEEHYIKYSKHLCTSCFKVYKSERGLKIHTCIQASKRNFVRTIKRNPNFLTCTLKPKNSDKELLNNDTISPTSKQLINVNTSLSTIIENVDVETKLDQLFITGVQNLEPVYNIEVTVDTLDLSENKVRLITCNVCLCIFECNEDL